MRHIDVVDWRVWKAAQVAVDTQPLFPGGDPLRAGNHVYVITTLHASSRGPLAFITPSPVLLALDVAIGASKRAAELREQLAAEAAGPNGAGPWVAAEQLTGLYRFFTDCMIAVTFSYQAVEAFANQRIAQDVSGTIQLKRKKAVVEWTAVEIERRCSTEEKVGTILPGLYKISSPKGTKSWENLMNLKDARDSTAHLKSVDQYIQGSPDDQSLYYRLLAAEPLAFPRAAIELIRHFAPVDSAWLAGAEAQF